VHLKNLEAYFLCFQYTYYWKSYASHAVAIVGYDKPTNVDKPIKFRVENSWGKINGEDGFYHMYREWFDKYVYFIIVPNGFLTDEEFELWTKSKPKKIPEDEPYF